MIITDFHNFVHGVGLRLKIKLISPTNYIIELNIPYKKIKNCFGSILTLRDRSNISIGDGDIFTTYIDYNIINYNIVWPLCFE